MSFGVSISDAVLLTQMAWKTVQNARRACGEYDDLSQEVQSLHGVLRKLEHEIKTPESPLNHPNVSYKEELKTTVNGCKRVLNVLDVILTKYNKLSEKERSTKKLWQRIRFGNGEVADLRDQRSDLTYYTSALGLLLNMACAGSMGGVEKKMDDAGGDLKDIKAAVNGITAQLMSRNHHEGSVLTAYTDDDKAVWKEFRRELIRDGFSSSTLKKHRTMIKAYVTELGNRGLFDENDTTPVTEEEEKEEPDYLNHISRLTQSPPSPSSTRAGPQNLTGSEALTMYNTPVTAIRTVSHSFDTPVTMGEVTSRSTSGPEIAVDGGKLGSTEPRKVRIGEYEPVGVEEATPNMEEYKHRSQEEGSSSSAQEEVAGASVYGDVSTYDAFDQLQEVVKSLYTTRHDHHPTTSEREDTRGAKQTAKPGDSEEDVKISRKSMEPPNTPNVTPSQPNLVPADASGYALHDTSDAPKSRPLTEWRLAGQPSSPRKEGPRPHQAYAETLIESDSDAEFSPSGESSGAINPGTLMESRTTMTLQPPGPNDHWAPSARDAWKIIVASDYGNFISLSGSRDSQARLTQDRLQTSHDHDLDPEAVLLSLPPFDEISCFGDTSESDPALTEDRSGRRKSKSRSQESNAPVNGFLAIEDDIKLEMDECRRLARRLGSSACLPHHPAKNMDNLTRLVHMSSHTLQCSLLRYKAIRIVNDDALNLRRTTLTAEAHSILRQMDSAMSLAIMSYDFHGEIVPNVWNATRSCLRLTEQQRGEFVKRCGQVGRMRRRIGDLLQLKEEKPMYVDEVMTDKADAPPLEMNSARMSFMSEVESLLRCLQDLCADWVEVGMCITYFMEVDDRRRTSFSFRVVYQDDVK